MAGKEFIQMLIFFNFREMYLKENLFKNAYFFQYYGNAFKGSSIIF